MGVNRSLQHESTAPTIATCPACASAETSTAFATRTTIYRLCRTCDHIWLCGRAKPDAADGAGWTSMAFRITRRTMAILAN